MTLTTIDSITAAQDFGASTAVPNRLLLIDGDTLAYYAGSAKFANSCRLRVRTKIRDALRASGASTCYVLLTGYGSSKGGRRAVARRVGYQSKRKSHRPVFWNLARDTIIASQNIGYEVRTTVELEADDLFGMYGKQHGDRYGYIQVYMLYEDKDMSSLPGVHLAWDDCTVQASFDEHTFDVVGHNGKQYGTKWFWEQMLHGDTADTIPGLPQYRVGDKLKKLGDKTSPKLLADCHTNHAASLKVLELYQGFYNGPDDDWAVEMLEQACLLWIRRGKFTRADVSLMDVRLPSSHFNNILSDPLFDQAAKEIIERTHKAQGTGGIGCSLDPAD